MFKYKRWSTLSRRASAKLAVCPVQWMSTAPITISSCNICYWKGQLLKFTSLLRHKYYIKLWYFEVLVFHFTQSGSCEISSLVSRLLDKRDLKVWDTRSNELLWQKYNWLAAIFVRIYVTSLDWCCIRLLISAKGGWRRKVH